MKLRLILLSIFSIVFLEATSIETNKNIYATQEKIEVSFNGMLGDSHDWIAIYPKGSSNDWGNVVDWKWTDGIIDGLISINGIENGEYEIRAFFKNSYNLEASHTFKVDTLDNNGVFIQTDKPEYFINEPIKINFKNLSNNTQDWIAIYPKGSSSSWENVITWKWTDGLENGEIEFNDLPIGDYEVRAFLNNSYHIEASYTFNVKAVEEGSRLRTSKDQYNPNEPIVVNFQGMSGNDQDWMAIYLKGSNNDWENIKDWKWINGAINGKLTFTTLDIGSYEVRAFFNNSYNTEATYTFSVQDKKRYTFNNIVDSSNAYYGDWLSHQLFIINLDKMSLEKTLYGGEGSYGLEPVGRKILISLTRKDTSIDIVDVPTKEIVRSVELGYQPREVTTSPNQSYSVVSGRDIPAHTIFNAKTGSVIQHFDRNQNKVALTDFGGQNATGHPFFVNNDQYLILDRVHREIRLYSVNSGLQSTLKTATSTHHVLRKGEFLYVSMEGSGNTPGEKIAPAILKIAVIGTEVKLLQTASLENAVGAGIHHFNFHYDAEHIYTGSNDGYVYVINSLSMEVVDRFQSGFGGGHIDFSKKHQRAMVTNHKSSFITLVDVSNPDNNKILKDKIEIAENIAGKTMQGHTQIISDDEHFFYGAATEDGNFFKVNLLTGALEKKLSLGAVHLEQGFMYQSPEGGFAKPIKKFSHNSFILKSLKIDNVLSNQNNRTKIDLSVWNENKSQAWDVQMRFNNYFNLKNRLTGACLTFTNGQVEVESCQNSNSNQLWEAFIVNDEGGVSLINKGTKNCLELKNVDQLTLRSCNNSSEQLWDFSSIL